MAKDNKYHFALTGGIASGKSHVSDRFAQSDLFTIIDADIIARQLTAANGLAISAIQKQFGENSIDSAGAMNRAYMRQLVFDDAAQKLKLEAILHPMIRHEMKEQRANISTTFSINVIPLLIETHQETHFHRVIVVDTLQKDQISRLLTNRSIAYDTALKIVNQQASRAQRLSLADDVLYNHADLDYLDAAIALLINWYQKIV